MSGEIITGIQLVFYAVVIICLGMVLNKLERISGFLAQQAQSQQQTKISLPSEAVSTDLRGEEQATEAEIAAVLAVIAKLMPDKQVATVRMVSK